MGDSFVARICADESLLRRKSKILGQHARLILMLILQILSKLQLNCINTKSLSGKLNVMVMMDDTNTKRNCVWWWLDLLCRVEDWTLCGQCPLHVTFLVQPHPFSTPPKLMLWRKLFLKNFLFDHCNLMFFILVLFCVQILCVFLSCPLFVWP